MLFCRIPGCPDVVSMRRENLYCGHYVRLWRYGDPLAGGARRLNARAGQPVQDHGDGTRTCNGCGERKPLDAYALDKNCTGGRRSQCKRCMVAKESADYFAHQEERKAKQRAYRVRDADRVRQQDRERYERDKAKRIELAADHAHRRRARLLGLPQDYGITVRRLRERDGDQCYYCKSSMDYEPADGRTYRPTKATIEHVLPLARGGYHVWENVVLACWQCNLRKNRKTTAEWRPEAAGLS